MNEQIEALNDYMSNLKVEINNLYNMHFNIVGSSFYGLHKKMKEFYDCVSSMYDSVAERIRMKGGFPITSLKEMENKSQIKSMISQDYNGNQVLDVLQNDFSYLSLYTTDLIEYFNKMNDFYTSSMLNENLKFFEKELWMIKSSLK